jgi:glutamate--cysteine ligase
MLTIPHSALALNTTTTEQLYFLEKQFVSQRKLIDEWFQKQWKLTPPPVYGSIDLRNAGFKLAPIDMNLFPAGFNNLNKDFLPYAIAGAEKIIKTLAPTAKRILVIPEGHTRNLYYWANIQTLKKILENAGYEIRFGALNNGSDKANEMSAPQTITLESGENIIVEVVQRKDDKLFLGNSDNFDGSSGSKSVFVPDFILLNNDLSDGIPDSLQNLKQAIMPPVQLGWSQRLKSEHFQYYALVAAEFGELLGIDPWLISPLFRYCGEIDFMQQEGTECLTANAEILFAEIEKKYQQYNIPYQPFLIVKADAGTYGMAVMTVRNIEELKSMNRKQRSRMSTTKGGQPVRRVIIQEGVYTFETFGTEQAVAEPVIYLWGSCAVGGFYRVHQSRGVDENLNSPGMTFESLAFAAPCSEPREELEPDACPNRFYTYGVIAQLSMLAAAREIVDVR